MSVHSVPVNGPPRRSSRIRSLTVPASEEFRTRVDKYERSLQILNTDVDIAVDSIGQLHEDTEGLQSIRKHLEVCQSAYFKTFSAFRTYLESVRTKDSEELLNELELSVTMLTTKLKLSFRRIEDYMRRVSSPDHDDRSSLSTSSHRSARSRKSQVKENDNLKQEKEELESRLRILKLEEKIRTTKAKLKNAQESVKLEDKYARTNAYVESLQPALTTDDRLPLASGYKANPQPSHSFNPMATSFLPGRNREQEPSSGAVTDLAKFLVKKELLLSRISSYDDTPYNYLPWKMSFTAIMQDLDATASEELDFLVRFLGPESSKHALTIRRCNTHNPDEALSLVWQRLEQRFGSPELIDDTLKQRISNFPKIGNHDNKRLYDLADLASEVLSIKRQPRYTTLFGYYDSPSGVNPLLCKLPSGIQDKWATRASSYKKNFDVMYPPFGFFVEFIKEIAEIKNDPSFQIPFEAIRSSNQRPRVNVLARKTDTDSSLTDSRSSANPRCPIHHSRHSLNDCKGFRQRPFAERKKFVLNNGFCLRCCGPVKHFAKDCKANVQCSLCDEKTHPTALHEEKTHNEGEKTRYGATNMCTKICGTLQGTSKSCAKIIPVAIYPENDPDIAVTTYAILDDQSNRSLAAPALLDKLNCTGPEIPYLLTSCSGQITTYGRTASGLKVSSLDSSYSLKLPSILECHDLPNNRDEIPSPVIAEHFKHLQDISSEIPTILPDVDIQLLIGRDAVAAHRVIEQRCGEEFELYAQRLPLGWTIIGPVCLNSAHVPDSIRVNKTYVMKNGRSSLLQPCENEYFLDTNNSIFSKTNEDEKLALSLDDQDFIDVMDKNFRKDDEGHWVAPLPFKSCRQSLPNNKTQAMRRAITLDRSLRRDPIKYEHVNEFMTKIFSKKHAEKAPDIHDNTKERWYLPMFGVYHPKKPGSIRMVFDSSAKFNGISLNEVLLKGPNITNNLQGILLRFRREKVAMIADVEQMFHNFRVDEKHRDYLRFLWHPEHDVTKPLEEYRMTVHVFGNRPSPSVATFGLRRSVADADEDVKQFVSKDFYVDDGLFSRPDDIQAVDLMKRTQAALLHGGQLRLHKIASNSKTALQMFPKEDLAKGLTDIDFSTDDELPIQKSLGLSWDINSDNFIFKIATESKPFTRRGALSLINSIFDPIGFTSPVTLTGKILLREMMKSSHGNNWDDPIDDIFHGRWSRWVQSLSSLKDITISRPYCSLSVQNSTSLEVHIFCDASKDAIAAAAYLRVVHNQENRISFLFGKTKVAPTHGHTIPRLELCAAVLAIEVAELIEEHLCIPSDSFFFYSDSQVVLGYISNETRRFYVYVANRVSRIRSFSSPLQWYYVKTDQNPSDCATRGIDAQSLSDSLWLKGPKALHTQILINSPRSLYPLVNPEEDGEIKSAVTVKKTIEESRSNLRVRFERFSKWKSLIRSIALLIHICCSTKQACNHSKRIWHYFSSCLDVNLLKRAEIQIIQQTQFDFFGKEIKALQNNGTIARSSNIITLTPFLDSNGVLRVGGRIQAAADALQMEAHPIIVPKKSHLALLLTRFAHESVHHQGRHLTEGRIRTSGFWIIGSKRLVSKVIHNCFTCRKLRGSFCGQIMADLPPDRLIPGPPFSYVGVDTFGPWEISTRRTRGGVALSKRWAIMFSCLVSRAIHIEVIEDLSASCFINALRRFVAIRGPVKQFRSDRGTNFVGAVKELKMLYSMVEKNSVQNYLKTENCTWMFNPPHASHFGGSWERMIGITRRILDSVLLSFYQALTHETLTTLLMEVCAVINSRPLIPVSNDPEDTTVLTPAMLITQKSDVFPEMGLPSQSSSGELCKSQWRQVQAMANTFWKRWQRDYISTLQPRRKWGTTQTNLKTGDVVLLSEPNKHRNTWPLGVITRVFPSPDDNIREAEVRVFKDGAQTTYVRPIHKLILLIS